jgi:hypothetical protein
MSTRKGDLIRFSLFGSTTFVLMLWLPIRWLDPRLWCLAVGIYEGHTSAATRATSSSFFR